jgi:hypothetical protein
VEGAAAIHRRWTWSPAEATVRTNLRRGPGHRRGVLVSLPERCSSHLRQLLASLRVRPDGGLHLDMHE